MIKARAEKDLNVISVEIKANNDIGELLDEDILVELFAIFSELFERGISAEEVVYLAAKAAAINLRRSSVRPN